MLGGRTVNAQVVQGMIKHFCDRCEREVPTDGDRHNVDVSASSKSLARMLCSRCDFAGAILQRKTRRTERETEMSADREMDHLENMSGMNGPHTATTSPPTPRRTSRQRRTSCASGWRRTIRSFTPQRLARYGSVANERAHPRRFAGLAGLFRGVLGVPALHVAPGAAVIRATSRAMFPLACVWGWLHLGKERQAREWDAERLQIWLRRMWRSE